MAKKAAVVIGVDQTGNLAKLTSAAAGAEAVAVWLREEGFDVECLTDKASAVEAGDIKKAIKKFVTLPPRYNQLVVYFSGHGYWHARTDLWLLSGAPADTDEAINLDGAMDLARYSGIPNVVFVSDACRSIPDSRGGARVRGVDAFPNYDEISTTSKVDFFKATSEARAAYEGDVGEKTQSILTYALMSAYTEPRQDMVRKVMDDGDQVQVVPNRKLEDYLRGKITEILAEIDINLTQNIEANVASGDDVYIARVRDDSLLPGRVGRRGRTRSTRSAAIPAPASVGRSAADAVSSSLRGGSPAIDTGVLGSAVAEIEARLPSEAVDHFESGVGFVIHGAEIVNAVTTKGENDASVEVLEPGVAGQTSAILRLWDVRPAVSIAIELANGRCAVLAGLHGYIGHASFGESGLSNVSYVPSSNHWRWGMYKRKRAEIDRFRALVALAVEDNAFRIESDAKAKALAKTIRIAKAVDPTLGLYAAYAFSQTGDDKSVLSVMRYMRSDLGVDLFDVRALALRRLREPWSVKKLAPFCPMLTQTWNLLRPRGIELPAVLEDSVPFLCNALWTTFEPERTDAIMNAVKQGEWQ